MRNTVTMRAIGSVLQMREPSDAGARERVLAASFWLPAQTRRGADVIALDAVRARREARPK
jgi:hypothetical protein